MLDRLPTEVLDHTLRVARGFEGALLAVALLHDVIEDTETTLDELRAADVPENIVAAVDAISRRPGEVYADYIDRVALDPLAREVKLADLRDHLETGGIPDSLIRRYERALERLEKKNHSEAIFPLSFPENGR